MGIVGQDGESGWGVKMGLEVTVGKVVDIFYR